MNDRSVDTVRLFVKLVGGKGAVTPSKKRAKYGIGLQSPSPRTSTWFSRALMTETLKEKGVSGGWGRACSLIAGSRHLTVDHKPISRWSTPSGVYGTVNKISTPEFTWPVFYCTCSFFKTSIQGGHEDLI